MEIIDVHIHFSRIDSFIRTAESISRLDYSREGFIKAFKEANVVKAIGMGLTEQRKGAFPDDTSPNPMLLDLDDLPRGLYLCPGVNPAALKKNRDGELEKIERIIREKTVAGIKIYAGYYPYYVYDSIYEPVYALAEKYGLPLVIHTGVTYSEKGLLKYSHPLTVDEAAVRFPKNIFVVAHLGDPWHLDACALLWKNSNVYADLSGLLNCDKTEVEATIRNPRETAYLAGILAYADVYDRLLFGSDWPLVPVLPYIEYIKEIIPEKYHEAVFYKNALNVFAKLNEYYEKI
jgi:hypothetical protein